MSLTFIHLLKQHCSLISGVRTVWKTIIRCKMYTSRNAGCFKHQMSVTLKWKIFWLKPVQITIYFILHKAITQLWVLNCIYTVHIPNDGNRVSYIAYVIENKLSLWYLIWPPEVVVQHFLKQLLFTNFMHHSSFS